MASDNWQSSEKPSSTESDKLDAELSTKVIVILKSNPQSMKTVEAFLTNRGWTIYSTHQLRAALAFIIQKTPSYVLLASDHSNKKTKALPKIIHQAFSHTTVIGFTEDKTNSAVASLQELGLEYSLYPPVSGPSVERMILKIQKDSEHRTQDSEENIKFAAGKQSMDSTLVKSSVDAARIALQQLIRDGDSEHSNQDKQSQQNKENSGPIIQKGVAGEKIFYNPNEESAQAASSSESSATKSADANYLDEKEKNPVKYNNPEASESDPNAPVVNWSLDEEKKKKEAEEAESERKKKSNLQNEIGLEKNNKKPNIHMIKSSLRTTGKEDSIIVKGTQTALDETVRISGDIPDAIENIKVTSNLACITVKSPRFSGYLVAALGKDRKLDNQFMNMVKERLFTFLRNHGEPINEEEESMSVEVEQVDFEEWALNQAEFLRRSIHGSDEIAMAFFPTEDTKVNLEKSVSENMLQMKVEELQDDAKLDFDLYIYMPENQKYLLYTPEGQRLFANQKERLKTKGVTHMHLRKEKVTDVKRYKVKNFLNDKIEKFKKKT